MDTNTTCFLEGGIGISIACATFLIPVSFFLCGSFAYIFTHKFSTKCGAIFTLIVSFILGGMEMFDTKHFVHGLLLLIPITICIIVGILLREKIKDFLENGGNDAFEEKVTENIKDFIKGFKMGRRKY